MSKQFWTRDDSAAKAIVPADYDVEQFKRLCERDRQVRVYPKVLEADDGAPDYEHEEPRDAEEFFVDEQCPSESAFR